MKTHDKITSLISCFLIMALLLTAVAEHKVMAAGNETAYIAKATAHYKHPVTGQIEDSGNNEGLGQSMTESVLHSKALIEEMSNHTLYATARIFLTDNIKNVKVWTQKKSGGSYTKANLTVMQENVGGKYCTDYRFKIPEKTAIVKMSLYVTPMEREVIFFFTFSDWKEGSADFITSIANSENVSSTADNQKTATQAEKESAQEVLQEHEEPESTEETKELEQEELLKNISLDSGEELIANAQGLILSDDSLLASETQPESENASLPQQAESESEQSFKLSWILVWQCILIITVPALFICITVTFCFRFMDTQRR